MRIVLLFLLVLLCCEVESIKLNRIIRKLSGHHRHFNLPKKIIWRAIDVCHPKTNPNFRHLCKEKITRPDYIECTI